ncbi:Aromatic-L-amino-acid decarboxylase [Talaromyces pinophilus]|nr:Aromatic-L-amino-acid decarboxylase [Talaromyces pinophilus]
MEMGERQAPPVRGMNAETFRQAALDVIEDIINYNRSLPQRPVLSQVEPGFLEPQLPSEAPYDGEAWAQIRDDTMSKVVPGITHWQSPNYFAIFPAIVTYPSILGEMYSAAFTAPAFNWLCSPASTELETIVMDWLAKALHLPNSFLSTSSSGGGGVIHGSASEAITTVMVAARERYVRTTVDQEGLIEGTSERENRMAYLRTRLVAIGSEETHSSTRKAAIIASTQYRMIPVFLQEGCAITGSRLEDVLEKCREEDLHPFYLTATLGTTTSCAVDLFHEISYVKQKWPLLWVHVDAAYAGAALICEEYQHYSKQMESFDSFNFNMHKWLLVNFDCSCLFIKRRGDLTRTFNVQPAYLRNSYSDSGLVTDYRDWQIPLGRRFRALKVWFVMRTYGIKGLQEHIRRSLRLGDLFADLLKERSDIIEVLSGPSFALTCFRISPEAVNDNSEQADKFTLKVAELINGRGQIMVTASRLAGHAVIRVLPANANVTEESTRRAFEIICRTIEETLHRL